MDLMTSLAIHGARAVSLISLANRHQISRGYAEGLVAQLRVGGLVTSFKGITGGYCLARPPSAISVADIVLAVDDDAATDVLRAFAGVAVDDDHSAAMWRRLSEMTLRLLEGVSLRQLAQREIEATGRL
ncbi:hypothetical protein GCM10007320_66660 [Pseudorhodoferax aquiterrae]|uniref:Rrf2 family transcriptional regulator n=1 Tax=Pseudorhodoferax aquiterrae TaxID=747304 RepID=A0ABQ3GHY4_9BURK|nr:hypothetical protein GCM10007320_66660 [Pseudorhodoferax aquiterrae]